MFTSIWEDIRREFSYGNMVTRIIIVNVMVFVVINLIWVGFQMVYGGKPSAYPEVLAFFSMPSDWLGLLTHPWALITSMFLHEGFLHILFNMLMLYWFGRIIGDLLGDHRVLPLYLMAGLAGNIVYFFTANTLPFLGLSGSIGFGASGAVMGIVIASAVLAPDSEMRLILIGNIKLKYIAVALLLIDIFAIGSMNNAGGHFAHLGGAAFGWFFIRRLQFGDDLSAPVNNLMTKIADFFRGVIEDRGLNKKKGPRMAYRNPQKPKKAMQKRQKKRTSNRKDRSLNHQEKVDTILDKIKESGYENLTQEEKEYLFNASKK